MDWSGYEYSGQQKQSWYDQAQICKNGHLINSTMKKYPEYSKKFCPKCGKETICTCENCGNAIQGELHVEGIIGFGDSTVPSYCKDCGTEFPWTKAKLEAAIELLKEDEELSEEDIKNFENNIHDAMSEGPRTTLAATRIGKVFKKTSTFIGEGVRDIIVDVLSETAKKTIWPS
ncbi:DUF2321 domain-containing protein [Paenibacillus silvae]|uniref:DUF2321 domain-containing protein n=1 Tax=Paenibacillus silvae TaxID=1325358 RepID=UPI0025A14021|nr:DUF2321 domain-containing protein [Paenibacillus silvae]MDM5277158.1 DUF2321 domain-containing protein [Paenibacillus silvae]